VWDERQFAVKDNAQELSECYETKSNVTRLVYDTYLSTYLSNQLYVAFLLTRSMSGQSLVAAKLYGWRALSFEPRVKE